MLVIYGAPAVGKTTLATYLHNTFNLTVMELDDEIKRENNGVWPEPAEYRNREITPKVLKRVAMLDKGIFLTSGLNAAFVQTVRNNNGKVVLLHLSEEHLRARNSKRNRETGHDVYDQIQQNLKDQARLKTEVGFDYVIDANQTTEEIAAKVLNIVKMSKIYV
ncbi:MAG: hypothetical protein RI947_233 [Candidatus Parcubacteria bacterium]|jgi:dephospho-CoA kinase